MKRLLTFSLAALLLFGGTFSVAAPTVFAQTAGAPSASSTQQKTSDGSTINLNNNPANPDHSSLEKGYNSVMLFIMGIFAWLVGVAALLLDYAVYYTVVGMGGFVHGVSSIGVVWKTLRDIGNIILIFGFMAVGISIILDSERLGYGRQMLPTLLVIAVFMNFSLFAAEAVIDVGNLFATEIYAQINGGNLPQVNSSGLLVGTDGHTLSTGNEGISNKIMNQLGLTTLYNSVLPHNAPGTPGNKTILSGTWPSYMAFMGVLLFITTAFVMFSLAFILIARFVMLILLIIVSPIGFAGLAVPRLTGLAKRWWRMLFTKAFEAPVLLLVLYVALKVITDAQFLTGFGLQHGTASAESAYAGFVNPGGSSLAAFGSVTLSFVVAIGLLAAVTVVAKSMSASGGSVATKWGSKLSGIGLLAGGIGLTQRYSVGFGSRMAAKGLRNTRVGRTFVGRATADRLEKLSKESFDIRNSSELSKLTKQAGLDMGKGQKGGYADTVERRAESYKRAVGGTRDAFRHRTREKAVEKAKTEHEQAQKAVEFANASHANAKATHAEAVQKGKEYQQQVDALEKEAASRRLMGDNTPVEGLEEARENVQKQTSAIQSAAASLAQVAEATKATHAQAEKAEEAHASAQAALEAGSAKTRQEEYKKRLKGMWSMPVVGNAGAREYVKKNAKELKDNNNFEKMVQKRIKEAMEKEKGTESEEKPKEGEDAK